MDIASLVGLLMAAVLVVYGIVAKDGFGAMLGFLDKQSDRQQSGADPFS